VRFVRCIIAAVLGLTLSPLVITHLCGLSSKVVEIPIIVLCGLVLPLVLLRRQDERDTWALVGVIPALALAITLAYFSFLHSSYFPDRLLDESAIRWRAAQDARLK